MFCRISNAFNSYFGLPAVKELNVYIQPSDNVVLFGNQPFPCLSKPRRVSSMLVDSSRVQFFWQRSLVTSELRVTSFCVTSFYRSVGNLTSTLVQILILNSINLLVRISFQVILYNKRYRCNRFSVPEFVYYTANFCFKGWFMYLIDLMLQQMWWLSTL